MELENKLQLASKAVEAACRICVNVQRELIDEHTLEKKDRSPVTVADFAAQAVISHQLAEAFGKIPLIAEESTSTLRQPDNAALLEKVVRHAQSELPELTKDDILTAIDRGGDDGSSGAYWTLDPIDGTEGFLRNDQYAVALALIDQGEILLALLGCPSLSMSMTDADNPRGLLYTAIRGEGAYVHPLHSNQEPESIGVATIMDSTEANFCESVNPSHSSHEDSEAIAAELGITNPSVRIDSQCKYAVVARGEAAIYLRLPRDKGGINAPRNYIEKIWDHAAGALIVEEAGGRVSDLYGTPLDFTKGRRLEDNYGIVATNGILHNEVIRACRKVLKL